MRAVAEAVALLLLIVTLILLAVPGHVRRDYFLARADELMD